MYMMNFPALAARAQSHFSQIVEHMLPDGEQRGREYVALNPTREDGELGSFSINLDTGKWADFATDDRGGDVIALIAYLMGTTQSEAARYLEKLLDDLEKGLRPPPAEFNNGHNGHSLRNGHVAKAPRWAAKEQEWTPISPVPEAAVDELRNSARLPFHPLGGPNAVWNYVSAEGQLLHGVCRWDDHAKGKKEIRPVAYCQNQKTGATAWRYQAPAEPRPLYGLSQLAARPDAKVLVVEGEKTTDAAAKLFPDYVVVTSSGGAMAAAKADWSPLSGRDVIIWPDNDIPGYAYAGDVAELALKAGACSVRVVNVPDPKKNRKKIWRWWSGWDLANDPPPGFTLKDLLFMLEHAESPDDSTLSARISQSRWKTSHRGGKGSKTAAPSQPHQNGHADTAEDQKEEKEEEDSEVPLQSGWLPSGYRQERDGAISHMSGKDDDHTFLCSAIEIVAATRTAKGMEWGRLIRVKDLDGTWHEWPMPMSALAGSGDDYRAKMLNMGLRMAPGLKARNALHALLTMATPLSRVLCVDRTGWHGNAFLLPDETIGEAKGERFTLQTSGSLQHSFYIGGTPDGWQQSIGRLAVGNSRLAFGISMAFASTLLTPLNIESGGVHFRGPSSTGKSAVATAAGSACGGGLQPYARTWRQTSNGLEGVAATHNDMLLILDELGQVSPEEVGPTAYMLANGAGKGRARRDGSARAVANWRLLFLSTGEIGLADKMRESRFGMRRTHAGQEVRLLDLPSDASTGHGVFDTLHEFETGAALADHLKDQAALHFGHPLRAFIKHLVTDTWQDGALAALKRFVVETVPAGADGQTKRAARRFAVIAVAGELAISWGITGWPDGEATMAAKRLFGEWLTARGGTDPVEITAGIAAVRHFLDTQGTSRFAPWQAPTGPVRDCVGFRLDPCVNTERDPGFYIFSESWSREVLPGHDADLVARELARRGHLKTRSDGKYSVVERLPDGTQRRVYLVRSSFLQDEPDAQ